MQLLPRLLKLYLKQTFFYILETANNDEIQETMFSYVYTVCLMYLRITCIHVYFAMPLVFKSLRLRFYSSQLISCKIRN